MSETMPNFKSLAPSARSPRSCRARGFSQSRIRDTLTCVHPPEEAAMAIVLNHTIVPAHDKVASAEFFARIFGLEYNGPHSHFAPVRVNDGLTLDFDERGEFESPHLYGRRGRIRRDLPPGQGRGDRLWQRPALAYRPPDQSSQWRAGR